MYLEIWELVLLCWIVFGLGAFFGMLILKKIGDNEPYVGLPPLLGWVIIMMLPAFPIIGLGAAVVTPILGLIRKLRRPKDQEPH